MVSGRQRGRSEEPSFEPSLDVLVNPVVESFPWGVLAESPDRLVIAVNRRFTNLFAIDADPDALVGTDSRALWLDAPESGDWLARSIETRIEVGAPVRGELLRFSDSRVLERGYVPVRAANGELLAHLWLWSDVTTERRAEEYQLTTRKMEAVGRLAGGVAHDLNNALTAIVGHASLLSLELGDRPELAESVSEIQTASERAAALARNLLAFSRKQVLQPKRVDPAEVVRHVQQLLGRIIGPEIALEVLLPPGPAFVRVDAIKLENALLHLAMNARDAMPAGGALTLGLEHRDVGADEASTYPFPIPPGAYAVFSVSDTGAGISDDIRGKVFEPFFSTKPRHQGTGLGLSTVYGFVKQSEGFVWVGSQEGRGASIHIAIPLLRSGEQTRTPAEETSGAAQRGDRPATILVAEDEPSVLSVIRRGLEERGYKVLPAADGVEAMGILERSKDLVDVLVTDVIMPRMGGVELAKRAHKLAPRLPVIFTSGYSGDVLEYLQDAPQQFRLIEKPFMAAEVVRLVQETLDEG
jgi:two-component system, cell cycle sensor histidine kinase and response regulator CckA